MKIFISIIVLMFPFLLLSQSDNIDGNYNYKISYQLHYQLDSTNSDHIKSKKMWLYTGDNISRFSSAGQAISDSILNSDKHSKKSFGEMAKLKSQIPNYKFEYYIYKGIPDGKLSFAREIVDDNLRYIENLNDINWQISSVTKSLFGYKAQKAITTYAGRDYIAWFTEEIPISDGPYKFQGLPGLIIKIKDTENHYVFNLREVKKLPKPIKIKFSKKKFLTTSKSKFKSVKQQFERHPFSKMEQSGISFDFKKGVRERMTKQHKEKLKKRNNPIELE